MMSFGAVGGNALVFFFFFLSLASEPGPDHGRQTSPPRFLRQFCILHTHLPTVPQSIYVGKIFFFESRRLVTPNALSELCYSLLVTSMSIIDGRNVINQLYPRVQMRPGDLAEAHQ